MKRFTTIQGHHRETNSRPQSARRRFGGRFINDSELYNNATVCNTFVDGNISSGRGTEGRLRMIISTTASIAPADG